MFWKIAIILFALWLLGFSFKIGGKIIHILIVIGIILILLEALKLL
jgi:hypothetical protein